MRILYLHQYYCPPGGWGNDRSRDFARCWAEAGHDVIVLTSQAFFPPEMRLPRVLRFQTEGHEVIALPVAYEQRMGWLRRGAAFVAFFLRALRLGARLPRPDVIYASSTPPTVAWLGRLLARRFGCPWWFEAVDVWPQAPIGMGIISSSLLARLLHAGTDPLYASARGIIALSEGMKDQIAERGVEPLRVHVIENGTRTDIFRPAPEDDGPPRVVYAGAIGMANGLEQLAEAARIVLARRPDVRFEVRGWGSQRDALAEQTADLSGFELLPPLPKAELAGWLRGATVGACVFAPYPVLEANSANKFYDFLACGLPVALNYGGWQARALEEAGCGLWVRQSDAEAYAEILLRLLDDAALRRRMGEAARLLAVQRYDRHDLAARTLALISG